MNQHPIYDLWNNPVATPLDHQGGLEPLVAVARINALGGPVHIKDPNQLTLLTLWEGAQ